MEILVQSFLDHDRVLLRGLILFAVVAYHHSSYDKNAHDQEWVAYLSHQASVTSLFVCEVKQNECPKGQQISQNQKPYKDLRSTHIVGESFVWIDSGIDFGGLIYYENELLFSHNSSQISRVIASFHEACSFSVAWNDDQRWVVFRKFQMIHLVSSIEILALSIFKLGVEETAILDTSTSHLHSK